MRTFLYDKPFHAFGLVTCLLICSFTSNGQITWQGTTTDWFTTSNWSCTCTPSGTDDVIIPGSASAYPTMLTGTASVRDITIASGASVSVGGTAVLEIAGTISNSGTLSAPTGTITFNGSGSAQTLSGSDFYISSIKNLIISNTSGVSISSALSIVPTGSVTVTSGATLTTNGYLILTSTSGGTARVATSAGTISGNVTVQRYIPGNRRAFRFLAHPFSTTQPLSILTDDIDITGTGGSLNGFTTTTSNNPSAFWYDVANANGSTSADAGWTAFTSTNGAGANAWAKGQGINVLIRGTKGQGLNGSGYIPSAVTLDMTGPINQGSQVITATRGAGSGYAFIGNPFPCQVNMSQIVTGVNIANNVYIWNAEGGTKGAYVATTYASAFILPAGGAFIAVAGANSSNTLTFSESAKTSSTPGTMLKTTSVNDNLLFTITSNKDSIWWDQLQINFDNAASNDSEWSNDAAKFFNPDASFYSYSNDNKKLAIDSRPYKNGEIISLGLENTPVGSYDLKADELNMSASGGNVFLHDKYLNTAEPVTQGFVHHFDVTTDPLTQGNRFALEMAANTNAVNSVSPGMKVAIVPNPASDRVTVTYASIVKGKAGVKVINMNGRVCRSIAAELQASGSIQVPVGDLPNGIYMIELTCGGRSVEQKLIKE